MLVWGARREVTGLALVVAALVGACGLVLWGLRSEESLVAVLARHFPEGPWRDAAWGVGIAAGLALLLTGLELVLGLPRTASTTGQSAEGDNSVARTVESLRKTLEECGAGEAPDAPRALDELLFAAASVGASDIHISPSEGNVGVSLRVDGVLHEAGPVPPLLGQRLSSRTKVLARLDGHARRPQDGVLRRKVGAMKVQARVSALPAHYGERIVLRLVRGEGAARELSELGFSARTLERLEAVLARAQGLFLVSGPVGSGKTTTLYSALQHLHETRKDTLSLVSLEDPIEVQLPFVTQTQMNPKAGMTFAETLRSVLRQDPGALMVGEIRDRETAEIAARAGLTGHLVLSTLHVSSAAGAFTRLLEMGVEPFVLGSTCIGALAQRLVRSLCECRASAIPNEAMQKSFREMGVEIGSGPYFQPRGCELCEGRGYQGRLVLAEILVASEAVTSAVLAGKSRQEVDRIARSEGMETLLECGLRHAREGRTSLEEVLRVIG